MYSKVVLTEKVLSILEIREYDIEKILFEYWAAPNYKSMRLTETGMKAFVQADIEYYDIKLSKKIKSYFKFVLELGKKINSPFYLQLVKDPCIRIFDGKVIVLINLFGSLEEYLEATN